MSSVRIVAAYAPDDEFSRRPSWCTQPDAGTDRWSGARGRGARPDFGLGGFRRDVTWTVRPSSRRSRPHRNCSPAAADSVEVSATDPRVWTLSRGAAWAAASGSRPASARIASMVALTAFAFGP